MPARYEFNIERTMEAPPARVFDALLDPEEQLLWWGGERDTVRTTCDLRVGGTASIVWGQSADALIRADQVFREIDRPNRIVYDETVTQAVSPVYACRLTFTLDGMGDSTRLSLHHVGFPTLEERNLHEGGTRIFLDRLARYLQPSKSRA